MRTYKKLALSVMTLTLSLTTLAQKGEGKERRAKIEAKKVSYCNDKAGLTAAEAENYWAIEAKLKEEKKTLHKATKDIKKMDLEAVTDEEIEAALKSSLETKVRSKQLELDYVDKHLEVLSAKKLALIKKAERSFKKEILRELKGPDGPGPKPEQRH